MKLKRVKFRKWVLFPSDAVYCGTCAHWGGPTDASFKSNCVSTLDIFEHNNLKDMEKKADYADCKYWVAITPIPQSKRVPRQGKIQNKYNKI